MPGDDTQGFDWQGLLKSATPYAAALIPAAIGGLAGGRLGGGALGAAAGFTSGMGGEQRAQDQYQQEAARVQQANVAAQRQQEQQQFQQQELKLRQQRYDKQDQLAEMNMQELQAKTADLKRKTQESLDTEQAQKDWGMMNLQGAERASYFATPAGKREDWRQKWEERQHYQTAVSGLAKQAISFGMDPAAANAVPPSKDGYDQLFGFTSRFITARQRGLSREGSYTEHLGTTVDADGNPVREIFDNHTGLTRYEPLPPGYTRTGGRPPPASQVQAFMDHEFLAQSGHKHLSDATPEEIMNWRTGVMGDLAGQRGNKTITQPQYEKALRDHYFSDPTKIDKLAEHRTQNDYTEDPAKVATVPGKYYGTNVLPYEDFIKSEKGQALLASHKANIIKELGAEPAPPPTGKPAPAGKPAAKPATRGAAEAATAPPAAAPKTLDENTATAILREAGGDKDKARQIAKQRGFAL